MGQGGIYQEIAAPTRLVQTEIHDGWDVGAAHMTTVFDERDGRTEMTATVRYPTPEIRDSILRTPMRRGAGESYDRLDDLLHRTVPKGSTP